jgi:hypothetical protein
MEKKKENRKKKREERERKKEEEEGTVTNINNDNKSTLKATRATANLVRSNAGPPVSRNTTRSIWPV